MNINILDNVPLNNNSGHVLRFSSFAVKRRSSIFHLSPSIVALPTLFLLLSSFFFLLSLTPLYAATYYINATGGKDANTGLSEAMPWKTISKVNGSKFNPGDHILFKRGQTWREQLTVSSGGSAGNVITIGAYGSGALPIIKGSDLVTGWTADSLVENVWNATVASAPHAIYDNIVRFDGTVGRRKTLKADLNSANEWYWSGTTLSVYSASYPDTAYTNPGIEANMRQFGIWSSWGSNNDYITIQNIEVLNTTETGIMIWLTNDNWIVDSCTTHNNGGPYGTYGGGYGIYVFADNAIVQNNTVYENADVNINVCAGANVTVQNNLVYGGNHGIVLLYIQPVTNPIVRYNTVIGISGIPNIQAGILASASSSGGISGYKVYYNLVYGPWTEGIHAGREGGAGDNTGEIYNNTVYDATRYNFYIDGTISLQVKNNIGYNTGGTNHRQLYIANASGDTWTNNDWYTTSAGVFALHEGTTYTDWATYKTVTGHETNSINTNPLFVSATGNDFHLLPFSPCINAGTDVGLTRDYIGNNKWGANWDIGAYEWTPSSPLPPPPENLRIIP